MLKKGLKPLEDKVTFDNYIKLIGEIKDLNQRIEKNREKLSKMETEVVSDSVVCGRKGRKPIKTVTVTGLGYGRINRQKGTIQRQMNMFERKIKEQEVIVEWVEKYIESMTDPELRTMFRLRFLDGYELEEVARRMKKLFPYKYTAGSCKMKIRRHFEKV